MEENEVWMDLGGDQIDQSLFLTNAANNINSYVNSRPWSSKRKNSFLNAYNAIMSSGVTGATNESGQWELTTANPFDPNSLSGRDQEMLGDAAHYILSQMQSVTPRSKEQQTNKPKTKFVGQTAFDNWISNNIFGGRTWDVGQDWNVLDERDVTTGKRGTAKRLAAMQNYLTRFAETVTDDNFDFEGTPFKNAEDVKARINNAVAALNGKTEVDQSVVDTLNALGLNSRQWFDNGLGEASGYADTEGNPLTWGQYSKYQQELAEQKEKEAAAKLKAQQQAAYNGTLFFSRSNTSKMIGRSAKELKEKYGESGAVIAALNNYSTRRFSDLTPDELSEVHGAMKNLARTSISDEMFKNLKKSSSGKYKSVTNKNRFKVIPGVDGYIWDSAENQVIQVQSRQGYNDSKLEADLFKGVQTDTEKEQKSAQERDKYLRSSKDGLTAAEWEELASIGFDIASIVDPEMVSAGALALTGSAMRHHAAANQPGGMSTSDKWWQVADYGLSILGSIPVLGDAALGARALNNLRKAIVPLGLVMAGANVPQAAKAAYNKVVKGENLTIQDWRAIGAVLTAAVGYGRGRQMSKRAEALQRTGGGTSKTVKEGSIKTDKGEIKGLSEKTTKELQQSFKKAGNNNEAKTKALREHPEVQAKAKEQGIKLEEASINTESSLRNRGPKALRETPEISTTTRSEGIPGGRRATLRAMAEFNRNHGYLARKGLAEQDWIFRHTGGYESVPQSSNWLKDAWNKIRHSEWDEFGNNKQNTPTSNSNVETPTPTSKATPITDRKVYREYQQLLNSASHTSPKLSRKYGLNDNGFGNRGMLENGESSINIFGQDIKFNVGGSAKNRTLEIDFGGEKSSFIFNKKGDNNRALRQEIVKTIKKAEAKALQNNYKLTKGELKKTREALLELRHTGKLKQGGQINKPVNQIISEFLNKQK